MTERSRKRADGYDETARRREDGSLTKPKTGRRGGLQAAAWHRANKQTNKQTKERAIARETKQISERTSAQTKTWTSEDKVKQ